MKELREGSKVKEIAWDEGNGYLAASDDVDLTVRMQCAETGLVPWVEAKDKDGGVVLYNCAKLSWVELK